MGMLVRNLACTGCVNAHVPCLKAQEDNVDHGVPFATGQIPSYIQYDPTQVLNAFQSSDRRWPGAIRSVAV